jgi:hypothetical protein
MNPTALSVCDAWFPLIACLTWRAFKIQNELSGLVS